MKKTLLATIVAGTLLSTSLYANDIEKSLSIGYANSETEANGTTGDDVNGLNLEASFTKKFANPKIKWGGFGAVTFVDADDSSYLLDFGAKIGYELTPKLSVYGTASYGFQDVDSGTVDEIASGFGLGVEAEYFFTDKLGAKLAYTQHAMEVEILNTDVDYDLKSIKASLVYKF